MSEPGKDVNISALLNSFQMGYDKRVRPNYGGKTNFPILYPTSDPLSNCSALAKQAPSFTGRTCGKEEG